MALLTAKPDPSVVSTYPELIPILAELISFNDSNAALTLADQACRLISCLCPTYQMMFSSSRQNDSVVAKLSSLSQPLAMRVIQLYRQSAGHVHDGKLVCLENVLYAFTQVLDSSHAGWLLSGESDDMPVYSEYLPSNEEFLRMIISLTRSPRSNLRLTSVTLLTKLRGFSKSSQLQEELTKFIIPVLLPIIDQSPYNTKAMMALASIAVADEKSAAVAVEVGLVSQIALHLKENYKKNTSDSIELTQSYLLALAGIGLHQDNFRLKIIDTGTLNVVIEILSPDYMADQLEDGDVSAFRKIKVAACHVLRVLGRSVKLLRTSLAAVDVADVFKDLLTNEEEDSKLKYKEDVTTSSYQAVDGVKATSSSNTKNAASDRDLAHTEDLEQLEVQTAVMAAICNLILEFSPLHQSILEKGFLDIIVKCAHSSYDPLRLNSIWALKNAVYEVLCPQKEAVMEKITWPFLLELCNDNEEEIQEQAVGFLRNFVCRNVAGLDSLFVRYGPNSLFDMIEKKCSLGDRINTRVLVAALYVLVHIAAGSEEHRDLLVRKESLLKLVVPLVTSNNVEIRTATIWLVINLTYAGGELGNFPVNEACKARAQKLVALGFREKLSQRNLDATLDIRERVRTALFQLDGYGS